MPFRKFNLELLICSLAQMAAGTGSWPLGILDTCVRNPVSVKVVLLTHILRYLAQ